METKRCPKCNQVKSVEEFHKQKSTRDGLARLCKSCYKSLRDDWKKREENQDYFKDHYEVNKEEKLEYNKGWREKNVERIAKVNREWYDKNIDHALAKSKEWKENNKEKVVKNNEKRYKENKEQILAVGMKYKKRMYKENPEFRLLHLLRSRLWSALKITGTKKSNRTKGLLGCSIQELKAHLEKQFREGMTWENQGKVWEIDHIKPCSSFDLTKEEEQKICFIIQICNLCLAKRIERSMQEDWLLVKLNFNLLKILKRK